MNVVKLTGLFLLLSASGMIWSSTAMSDTFAGTIQNDGEKIPLRLVVKNTSTSFIIDAQPNLMNFLRRFRTGDFMTAQGTLSADKKKVSIETVDRVGLQAILGAWRSSRWEIFEFKDYSQLNLYIPTAKDQGGVSLARTHSLKYVITPEQGNHFSIFMSDDNDVRMGFLEVEVDRLTLKVTDFKTGLVTENISLSPLRIQ